MAKGQKRRDDAKNQALLNQKKRHLKEPDSENVFAYVEKRAGNRRVYLLSQGQDGKLVRVIASIAGRLCKNRESRQTDYVAPESFVLIEVPRGQNHVVEENIYRINHVYSEEDMRRYFNKYGEYPMHEHFHNKNNYEDDIGFGDDDDGCVDEDVQSNGLSVATMSDDAEIDIDAI